MKYPYFNLELSASLRRRLRAIRPSDPNVPAAACVTAWVLKYWAICSPRLRPEAHEWVELPDTFSAKVELMARAELAPAMLFGARRLMLQMSGWLAARHCGVTAFTLRWCA